ncbi:MAG: ParB/RepB/Spo0J family partition protein [Nanoarchaeota archaeon]
MGKKKQTWEVQLIPPQRIFRDIKQPRRTFNQPQLEELANSIRSVGIIQPITVITSTLKGNHKIVSGERRWRASKIAGLEEVPCIVRELTDDEALAIQIIEDSQEPYTKAERAEGWWTMWSRYKIKHLGATKTEFSRYVGKGIDAVNAAFLYHEADPRVQELHEVHKALPYRMVSEISRFRDVGEQYDLALACCVRDYSIPEFVNWARGLRNQRQYAEKTEELFEDIANETATNLRRALAKELRRKIEETVERPSSYVARMVALAKQGKDLSRHLPITELAKKHTKAGLTGIVQGVEYLADYFEEESVE